MDLPLNLPNSDSLHQRLNSLLSVEDCYIFGSVLDVWGHSCRIDDLDFTFNLKMNPESDIDVGLENFQGPRDWKGLFGNRITVKELDGRRVEVYDFFKDNIFIKTKFPHYSKKTGLVLGDFQTAVRIYTLRKLHKIVRNNRRNKFYKDHKKKQIPDKVKALYFKTVMFNWGALLKLNISHSYDGVNFTKFTNEIKSPKILI